MLGLKAANCRNGDLLAEEQVTANGKEQVLKALGEAATKICKKLGESLASVEKYEAHSYEKRGAYPQLVDEFKPQPMEILRLPKIQAHSPENHP